MKGEITPAVILDALGDFLDEHGGLRPDSDFKKFTRCAEQLGDSMLHVCTYLHIIKATTDEASQTRLLNEGMWQLLYNWLADYKELDESPMLILLLDVFQKVPVTMEMLKSTKSAKVIKSLTKHTVTDVSEPAQHTVDKWMKLIKGTQSESKDTANSQKRPSDLGSHKHDKKKKREKRSEEEINRESAASPPSPPSPTGSLREGPRESANRHADKQRSAGVEEGLIKPKPRGSKPHHHHHSSSKKPQPIITNPSNQSVTQSASKRPTSEVAPPLEESVEKKPKLENSTEEVELGRVKIIALPVKPKQHTVVDSDGFMSDLLKPPARNTPTKRKKPLTANQKAAGAMSPPTTPTTPPGPAPPSFYRDLLAGPSSVSPPHQATSPPHAAMSPPHAVMSPPHTTSPGDESERPSSAASRDDTMSPIVDPSAPAALDTRRDSNASAESDLPATEPKPRKTVRWKPERELTTVHVIDYIPDERVNVNRVRSEGENRSDLLTDTFGVKAMSGPATKGVETTTELSPWIEPAPIDLPPSKFVPGFQSKEAEIQALREASVLQTFYFSKKAIPESAIEPDSVEDLVATLPPVSIPLKLSVEPSITPTAAPEAPRGASPDGLSQGVMETIQKLVKGEGDPGLLEALANANPADLNKLISSQTSSNLPIGNIQPQGFSNSHHPDNERHDDIHSNHSHLDNGHHDNGFPGHNGFTGPRQFGGERHWNEGRGDKGWRGARGKRGNLPGVWKGDRERDREKEISDRGGWRGRGRGSSRVCNYFARTQRCDFGTGCKYSHDLS